MSGAPTPPLIVEAFGINASGGYINLPIPVASQIPITPGAASFNDGFPPATMTPVSSGGTPPSGKDMNGILYTITAYLAALQAGQLPQYDATASAAFGGYKKGAILATADGSGLWLSNVAANVSNPDTGGAGWIAISPSGIALVAVNITAGAHNDYAPAGFNRTTGFLDLTPNAGNANVTGLAGAVDGQSIIITNLHAANTLTINALNGGSAAANQFRMSSDLILVQNNTASFRYSATVLKWIRQ